MSSTSDGAAEAYLPPEIPRARVLITVETYPQPSKSYTELVCTAGLLNGERWVRIYPVSLSHLQDTGDARIPKYSWVELDLVRRVKDFRAESYGPKSGICETIAVGEHLTTGSNWGLRKQHVLREVFDSMEELIAISKRPPWKSLATVAPTEITGFHIEKTDAEWREQWLEQRRQGDFFEVSGPSRSGSPTSIRKLPYRFCYRFLTRGDERPRQMEILDWEIGALFWNCLDQHDGDEEVAKQLVKQKYFDEFVARKDLRLFLGTTLGNHKRAPNPFTIIGVFYPPLTRQLPLF